jgi:hypothetical protein
MAADFLRFFTSCLPVGHKYALVNERVDKKDDDYLARKVEEWRDQFPIIDALGSVFFDHKSHAKKLVKAMLLIPVNETTVTPIAEHLCATAKKNPYLSDYIRQEIIKYDAKRFTTESLKSRLYTRVSHA